MGKRKSAFWMKQLDERILETLCREGWSTPKTIARESRISCSKGHIRERIEKLRHTGFVGQLHGDMFVLTRDGKLYLNGEIDANNRPWPPGDRMLQK
jgi:isopentenyl phosphate kinase